MAQNHPQKHPQKQKNKAVNSSAPHGRQQNQTGKKNQSFQKKAHAVPENTAAKRAAVHEAQKKKSRDKAKNTNNNAVPNPLPSSQKQKAAKVQIKPKTAQTELQIKAVSAKRQEETAAKSPAKMPKPRHKLRVMMLGGLNEIGKNIAVFEYGDDIIVVDCGLAFPDEDMLGIDLVIPDISYLEANADKIRGIFITHGHEDHIGALPYVLRTINPPIYGTRLTLGIIENKLEEHKLNEKAKLITVEAGSVVNAGVFRCEFIHVNHSIADACAIAIRTPVGTVVHSGDFKLDVSPIDGSMMDVTRLGEYGNEGVMLLMCESTNVERSGYTPSEKTIASSLEHIFLTNTERRIVVATFSSNVHRVQQIIDVSVKFGRKVAITGRSMINVIGAAVRLGYMTVPDNALIDITEIGSYPLEMVTIITTGSQGEPMSALYRMAFSDHSQVELAPTDLVVLSSHAIPGNEILVGRIINELYKRGINVYHDDPEVHVSGHACQEELKLMHNLVRPKFFMPIHGEYRHLMQHKELAEFLGMSPSDIFVQNIGDVLEFDGETCKRAGTVPSGRVLIDGYGIGDVGNIVLRDRKLLSQDGLIVVVATINADERAIVSGPDIITRGFVYVREAEELLEELRKISATVISTALDCNIIEWNHLKNSVKDSLTKYIFTKTKRKPMILPVIMNI